MPETILSQATLHQNGSLQILPDAFARFVVDVKDPVVVHVSAKRLLVMQSHTYRIMYGGFLLFCVSKSPLTLPNDAEVIEATAEA